MSRCAPVRFHPITTESKSDASSTARPCDADLFDFLGAGFPADDQRPGHDDFNLSPAVSLSSLKKVKPTSCRLLKVPMRGRCKTWATRRTPSRPSKATLSLCEIAPPASSCEVISDALLATLTYASASLAEARPRSLAKEEG